MKVNKSLLAVLSMFLILLLFVSSASAADTNETDVLSVDESVNLENNTLALDAASNDNNAVENDEILQNPNTDDILGITVLKLDFPTEITVGEEFSFSYETDCDVDTLSLEFFDAIHNENDLGTRETLSFTYNGNERDLTMVYLAFFAQDEFVRESRQVTIKEPTPVTDTWYVNSSATGGDGKSPETAFNSLNDALTNSELQDGNTIMIASGIYAGTNNTGLTINKKLNFIKYGDDEAIFDAEKQRQIWTVTSTSINMTGLTFKNGKADNGGAVSFSNYIMNCNIVNCSFDSNFASEDGGAINFLGSVSFVNITNNNFTNNKAIMDGGAIAQNQRNKIISNNTFRKNNFINNTGDCGGAIMMQYCEFSQYDEINFVNNTADIASAINMYGAFNCTFTKINIMNNLANNSGSFNIRELFNSTFNYLNVSNNNGGTDGILHFGDGVQNSFKNIEFINNTGKFGGALAVRALFYLNTLSNITFINNSAERGGCILYFGDGDGFVFNILDNITVINNNAAYGGAFYIDLLMKGNYFSRINFINNNATYGGAFYVRDYFTFNQFYNCNFMNNSAINGSVFYISSEATLNLGNIFNKSLFINNFADDSGLVYSTGYDQNTYDSLQFINNVAKNNAVLFFEYGGANITNCIFENNVAEYVTDIYDYKSFSTPLRVINSSFTGKNHIYVSKSAELELINNSELNSFIKGNFFVLNNGNLKLENNSLTNVIFNNGTIYSDTSIIVLDNETLKVSSPNVQLYAKCIDDNGNYIIDGGNLTFDINGTLFKVAFDGNSYVKANYTLENHGIYIINASMDSKLVSCTYETGTINYTAATVNGTDVVKMYRNATQYYATFLDNEGKFLANGTTVQFYINGVQYNRSVSGDKGLAKLNINLGPGEYVITAINLVTGENAVNNITVLSNIVENRDIIKYYKNATQYTVKIIGDDGKVVGKGEVVTFNVNGIFYNRTTDENGIATLNINLPPGDYIITSDYKGCKIANNITVLPILNASDISMKYMDGTQFKVNLVDGQGNPYKEQFVTFNINGKFYDRLTDSNGQAALNIRLPPGEYIITSSFNGVNIANKITITT